jgi:hypothetical protein
MQGDPLDALVLASGLSCGTRLRVELWSAGTLAALSYAAR